MSTTMTAFNPFDDDYDDDCETDWTSRTSNHEEAKATLVLSTKSNCCFPRRNSLRRRGKSREPRSRSKSLKRWRRKEQPQPEDLTTIETVDFHEDYNHAAAVNYTEKIILQDPESADWVAAQIMNDWIMEQGLYDDLTLLNTSYNQSNYPPLIQSYSGLSVLSQEGIEVGAHGYPMEGLARLDSEMIVLRNKIERELTLVNAQLNIDEQQGNLNDNDSDSTIDETNLAIKLQEMHAYPCIQSLIQSRQCMQHVFDTIDTFCLIPTICDELYRNHDEDIIALSKTCQQHCELQILLIKMEADLKDRMDDVAAAVTVGKISHHKHEHKNCYVPSYPNHGGVDSFLLPSVKLVWNLGSKLQTQLLDKVKNVHGMKRHEVMALVQSVELYEDAFEECWQEPTLSGAKKRLQVPPMRQLALSTLVDSFECRCYLVMQALQERAADDAQSQNDEQNAQFKAIHEAASMLMEQTDYIQTHVEPHVPPCWHVTNIWMICVATVCSQYMLQQIGGQEGNNLEFMSVPQLLQLVSWIEHFRSKAEALFPDMIRDQILKTKFESVSELFSGKEINDESTKEGLVSGLHVLWDIHRLAQDQLMVRTQLQSHDWLENVYNADHQQAQISGGRLITSLPEDVWALASVQLETIGELLPQGSCVVVDAACMIFHQMQLKQRKFRDVFFVDLETCCAAANDLVRMSEQAEQTLQKFQESFTMSNSSLLMLEAVSEELIRQYSNDAVYSAQSVHVFVFDALEDELAGKMFEFEWEDKTHNEMAMIIVRTIEDFLQDIEQWMENVMVRKAIDAIVKGCVNFYIRHLMLKAAKCSSQATSSCFQSNERALRRIAGDIKVMRDYFEMLVERFPPLARIIEKEFEVLENVFGLLAVATELDEAVPHDFLLVIQSHIRQMGFTRYLCTGLWKMVNPKNLAYIHDVIDYNLDQLMEFELKPNQISQEHIDVTLELSHVLQCVIEERKRGPLRAKIKAKAVEKMKKMQHVMKNLRRRGEDSDDKQDE